MISEIKNLLRHSFLLKELIKRDFKAKYTGSKIGLYWSFIAPLARLIIFIFIFSVVLKVRFDGKEGVVNFALYLVCGMLPWFSFQQSVTRSETVLLENANIIKYIVFPAKILPLSIAVSSLIDQMIGTLFFMIAVLLITHTINIYALPFLFVALFFQLIFTLGVSWLASALNILFKDTLHLIELFLMIWMYLTPIFYPESMIPQGASFLLKLNPMAYLVRIYREIFLGPGLPYIWDMAVFFLMALISFTAGYFVFEKNQFKFADLL